MACFKLLDTRNVYQHDGTSCGGKNCQLEHILTNVFLSGGEGSHQSGNQSENTTLKINLQQDIIQCTLVHVEGNQKRVIVFYAGSKNK